MHPELLNNPAFVRYYEAWQLNPASLVFAPIAEFYCQYKLYADARRICEAGVRANPQSVIAHYTLARTYVHTREWHAARHEAQWVLSRVPQHSGAMDVLRKVDQALSGQRLRVVESQPKSAPVPVQVTVQPEIPVVPEAKAPMVYTQPAEPEDFETVVIALPPPEAKPVEETPVQAKPKKRRATVIKPAPWHTVTMAKIYAQQGHFIKARTIYKTILNLDPENHEAKTGLESVERKMREEARA